MGLALLSIVALSGCYEQGANLVEADKTPKTIQADGLSRNSTVLSPTDKEGASTMDGSTVESGTVDLPSGQIAGTETVPCPFDLTDAELVERERKPSARSWTFVSSKSAPEFVEEVLDQSRDRGYKLVEATTLDLEGNAWGCVVSDAPTESVYLVTVSDEPDANPYGEDMSTCTVVKLGG